MSAGFIPPHGGYEQLHSYQKSLIIFVVGNVMVCLCRQACYLLDQQIRGLEQAFLAEGGIRERMTRARLEVSTQQEPPTAPEAPLCALCIQPMRQRTARQGPQAGKPFWGCSAYPQCKGARPV